MPCTNGVQGASGSRRGAHWATVGLEELGSWEMTVIRRGMKRDRIRVGMEAGGGEGREAMVFSCLEILGLPEVPKYIKCIVWSVSCYMHGVCYSTRTSCSPSLSHVHN